jgi:site-specific DNA-methyltransferase (adenine-specific)
MTLNTIFNEDCLTGLSKIPDSSVDLVCVDPPYSLGKDYGNNSDKQNPKEYLEWTYKWIDTVMPKMKPNASFYIFLSWQFSPEIFVYLKQKMTMMNEIIWDRRVPSMGGSTRKFSSVHDNLGFFVNGKDYYFDLDAIRIQYDAETKKARSRKLFEGAKWLEMGYNPKDLWSVSRIHAQNAERENHPTQKPLEIIERIIKASCPLDGIVLDCFMGSGTTAIACLNTGRNYIGYEVSEEYCDLIENRITQNSLAQTIFTPKSLAKIKEKFPLLQETIGI